MFLVLTLFLYLRTPQSTVLSACFFLSGVLVHGGGGGGGGFSFASKNNNINWKNLIIFEFTILFFFFLQILTVATSGIGLTSVLMWNLLPPSLL